MPHCHVPGEAPIVFVTPPIPQDSQSCFVKSSGTGSEDPKALACALIYDIEVVNFLARRPHADTSPVSLDRGVRNNQSFAVQPISSYPLTNGNAGGKLPSGKLGARFPARSFSAAVR